MQRLIFS